MKETICPYRSKAMHILGKKLASIASSSYSQKIVPLIDIMVSLKSLISKIQDNCYLDGAAINTRELLEMLIKIE